MNLGERLPDAIRRRYLVKFALVVAAVAVAVGLVGAVTASGVSDSLREDERAELLALAEQDAAELSQWYSTQRERARLLSDNGDLQSEDDMSEVRTALERQRAAFGEEVRAIYYVRQPSGTIAASTDAEMQGQNLQDIDLQWVGGLTFSEKTEVATSRVYENRGESRLAFASPVRDSRDVVVVVLSATDRAERFRDTVDGGYTVALNNRGSVQMAANESRTLSVYEAAANSTALERVRLGESGVTTRDDLLVAYAPAPGTELSVLKHAPRDNAYALSRTITERVVVLVGMALFGFVLLGAVVHRGTLTTLRGLTEDVTALARGDLDTEVSTTDRIDEVGRTQTAVAEVSAYLRTVDAQAEAIADQSFDDPALDESVPGRLGESLDRMQADLETSITEIEQAREDAERAQAEAEALAGSLQTQAEQFGEVMALAAEGDLTRRLDTDIDNEAMREIAEASNRMLRELESTVVRISEFAAEVDDSSGQITASAREVRNASEEVSRSVQEIASGADRQNDTIQQASEELSTLSAAVEEVAASSDEIATRSAEAAETGEGGRQRATDAIEEMTAIEARTAETVSEVERLAEEMDRIGEVVDLIDDIAEQTNMLALNASIEAARAGEAGDGFAVVADEIKGLAEETGDATQEVAALIEEVQAATDDAVRNMHETQDRVDTGIDTVESAVQALAEIVGHVEEVNDGIQSVSDAADEQAASTEESVAMIDEVGSISEETASQAEDVAAAAEEQTASLDEVTEGIGSLSDQATDLRDLLATFETGARTDPTAAATGGRDVAADGSGDD